MRDQLLSANSTRQPSELEDDELASHQLSARSTSVSSFYDFSDEQLTKRVRISYTDDALCAQALENVYRMLRAAKQAEEEREGDKAAGKPTPTDNSALLAQKALRYRRLLSRVQQTNLEDPAFDINEFLRLTWCKMEQPSR